MDNLILSPLSAGGQDSSFIPTTCSAWQTEINLYLHYCILLYVPLQKGVTSHPTRDHSKKKKKTKKTQNPQTKQKTTEKQQKPKPKPKPKHEETEKNTLSTWGKKNREHF